MYSRILAVLSWHIHEGRDDSHTNRFGQVVYCRAKFKHGTFRLHMRFVVRVGKIARHNHLEGGEKG
jgi:hypothetical protein